MINQVLAVQTQVTLERGRAADPAGFIQHHTISLGGETAGLHGNIRTARRVSGGG